MTRGENGFELAAPNDPRSQQDLAQVREHEARSACQVLGVETVHFCGGSDGRVAQQPELASTIARLLTRRRYERVLCPWPQDQHVDHIATYRWMRQALTLSRADCDLWLYEVWSPLRPNLVLPIDATIEAKLRAIDIYKSQLKCLDYRSAFVGLAAYRSLLCAPSRHAEAFITFESGSWPPE